METANIKLTSLFVNTENYRFEPVLSQKDSIDKMIEDQGDKLFNLAEDILQNGLSPIDAVSVTPGQDGHSYIVLEGNRRITALKLFYNPSLIDDNHLALRKKFQGLHKKFEMSACSVIRCIVFNTPSDADTWIKRKHSGELNGVGTVTWDAQQKQRFEEKTGGKSSLPLQVISLLKSREDVPDEVKGQLSTLSITNLQRLISDPYVRDRLGIAINEGHIVSNIDSVEVVKGLVKVVTDILHPEFKVSKIYNREKRKEYIDSIKSEELPDLTKYSESQWQVHEGTGIVPVEENLAAGPKKCLPDTTRKRVRNTVIPKNLSFHITNPKINNICSELKSISVHTHPNATAVLLRVFLEMSVDFYMENHGLLDESVLTASASHKPFQSKAITVVQHLKQQGKMNNDLHKGINSEIKDKHSILSIDSMNAYVHNEFFSPKAENLIIGWDNIQPFVVILWENIINE